MPGISAEEAFDQDLFKGRSTPAQTPTGMPAAETTSYEKAALEDLPDIVNLRGKFELAARKNRIPVEILAGVASRESRVGKALNKQGYDPDKLAYGVMQIDERFHKRQGKSPTDQAHIDQAAGVLKEYKSVIDKRFPKWSDDDRWRASVAAYNFGPDNVKSMENLDMGTTGNDYSEDVMQRARIFREHLKARGRK